MKSLLVILLAVCATFTSSLPAYAGERATTRVGVVLDGESSQLNTLLERVMSETRTIAKAGRDIEFPEDKRRVRANTPPAVGDAFPRGDLATTSVNHKGHKEHKEYTIIAKISFVIFVYFVLKILPWPAVSG